MCKKSIGGCHPRQRKERLELILRHSNYNNILTKRERVICWLIIASIDECRVTRFDAERIGDHCLNTTVSEIGRHEGIKISRAKTRRLTRFGGETYCKEYWVDEPEIQNLNIFFLQVVNLAR